jgi:hypothetical protein
MIGTLRETSLHAALKQWYAQPGDQFEVQVDGYVIDLQRGETLIEIQTRNFSAIKRKLSALVETHPVRLLHPIAREKVIVRLSKKDEVIERRRSPKRGKAEQIFGELVRIPELMAHPNFSLEIVLTREEEIQRKGKGGSWRRKGWRIHDRRLVEVVDRVVLADPSDVLKFLPPTLPWPFTNHDLSKEGGYPLYLAQKMTYCLRRMAVIEAVGKRGQAILYARIDRLM